MLMMLMFLDPGTSSPATNFVVVGDLGFLLIFRVLKPVIIKLRLLMVTLFPIFLPCHIFKLIPNQLVSGKIWKIDK